MIVILSVAFLSLFAFFIGYKFSRDESQVKPCINEAIKRTISHYSQSKEHSPPSIYLNLNHNKSYKALPTIFDKLKHATTPSGAEVIVTNTQEWDHKFESCQSIYATTSPVRTDHPNRCMAVIHVKEGHNSYTDVGHRYGYMHWPQKLTDQYQEDYTRPRGYSSVRELMSLFMKDREHIIQEFIKVTGNPVLPNGQRRTLVVMIANEGVMDLLLNLLCSAQMAPDVDMNNFIIILAQPDYIPVIQSMGVKAFYHPGIGNIPRESAGSYADPIFARVMWLKISSVYIALSAGFNVLFQDVDMVWMKSPIHYLESLTDYDVIFMDDGSRSPRFAPYYTNSGFYLFRYTEKVLYFNERLIRSLGELVFTASHQATLIRYLTEMIAFCDLQLLVLDDHMFPQGRMYHEDKKYVEDVKYHRIIPYVWHMCWTDDRNQKVAYYHNLGLWFLPDDNHEVCIKGPNMLTYLQQNQLKAQQAHITTNFTELCCRHGGYYT